MLTARDKFEEIAKRNKINNDNLKILRNNYDHEDFTKAKEFLVQSGKICKPRPTMKKPQDYIDSLNDELPPENVSIMADEYDDIELYAQVDNTDYINSNIASDDDTISEEQIRNGTGYELEKECVSSDEYIEDDSFSVL